MYHKRKNNKDLKHILSNLRYQDRKELELQNGKNWFATVYEVWKNMNGVRIAYLNDGTPISVFGVCRKGDIGIIGMLSTCDIEKERKSFLILGKEWVNSLDYKLLINYVYSTNKLAINWLRWLGFNVQENRGLGNKFLRFYKGDLTCVE